jgi:hypothetical protein
MVNVAQSPTVNSLTKTGSSTACDAGASSAQGIVPGDGSWTSPPALRRPRTGPAASATGTQARRKTTSTSASGCRRPMGTAPRPRRSTSSKESLSRPRGLRRLRPRRPLPSGGRIRNRAVPSEWRSLVREHARANFSARGRYGPARRGGTAQRCVRLGYLCDRSRSQPDAEPEPHSHADTHAHSDPSLPSAAATATPGRLQQGRQQRHPVAQPGLGANYAWFMNGATQPAAPI